MSKSNPFKWHHYEADIILRCVRWYCTYPLSYRQVAEMVNERGLGVNHTTIFRWIQYYNPERRITLPTSLATDERLMASRRNMCKSQTEVEVFVSSRGFRRQHSRLFTNS